MKFTYRRLLLLLVAVLFGCSISLTACEQRPTPTVETTGPQAPLEDTGKKVDPPPGCQDLRKRGGAC